MEIGLLFMACFGIVILGLFGTAGFFLIRLAGRSRGPKSAAQLEADATALADEVARDAAELLPWSAGAISDLSAGRHGTYRRFGYNLRERLELRSLAQDGSLVVIRADRRFQTGLGGFVAGTIEARTSDHALSYRLTEDGVTRCWMDGAPLMTIAGDGSLSSADGRAVGRWSLSDAGGELGRIDLASGAQVVVAPPPGTLQKDRQLLRPSRELTAEEVAYALAIAVSVQQSDFVFAVM